MFKTTGTIVYDPPRPGMNKRTSWWCVINIDREITRYFRWFIERNWWEVERNGQFREIMQPSWDAHVSVVRGEQPFAQYKKFWKKHHGEKVDVFYSPVVRLSGDKNFDNREQRPDLFYFVEVECDLVWQIRKELGLPCSRNGVPYKSHLTVARVKDNA